MDEDQKAILINAQQRLSQHVLLMADQGAKAVIVLEVELNGGRIMAADVVNRSRVYERPAQERG